MPLNYIFKPKNVLCNLTLLYCSGFVGGRGGRGLISRPPGPPLIPPFGLPLPINLQQFPAPPFLPAPPPWALHPQPPRPAFLPAAAAAGPQHLLHNTAAEAAAAAAMFTNQQFPQQVTVENTPTLKQAKTASGKKSKVKSGNAKFTP